MAEEYQNMDIIWVQSTHIATIYDRTSLKITEVPHGRGVSNHGYYMGAKHLVWRGRPFAIRERVWSL